MPLCAAGRPGDNGGCVGVGSAILENTNCAACDNPRVINSLIKNAITHFWIYDAHSIIPGVSAINLSYYCM